MSDGAGSVGICGVFRPIIALTDLSDLDGDALVGDDWLPCPGFEMAEDATAFLRTGFRLSFVLATDTGVGIRLLSSTFEALGVDIGGEGAALKGPVCPR
jgi:hypothetical protein